MVSREPFHAGERRAQEQTGVRERVAHWGRQAVRPYLPEQHRLFYEGLPFLVAAARDDLGRPWATLLAGRPGFVQVPTETSILVDAAMPAGDALEGSLQAGADIGVLGIDLATRRRNRMNGRLEQAGPPLRFVATQTFGNCPQYIHPRRWRWVESDPAGETVSRSARLNAHARRWIEMADTLFIASGYRGHGDDETFGMDASHRGGHVGFVEVASDTRLVFPDYAGNHFFNTIGNLVMDPRVGLLFVDFETGGLLQLTGHASIDWNPGDASRHAGAPRLVTIDIEEIIELRGVLPLRWSAPGESVRSLCVVDRVRETDDVTSFVLASRDGGPLSAFRAGQHLPIEIRVPGFNQPLHRSYSLSNGPGADGYRISVKREPKGVVSRHLHDSLARGDMLNAAGPAGDFHLVPGDRPVALISAGIGITPMMSILHQLAGESPQRSVWFIHGARSGRHHAFAAEAKSLVEGRHNIRTHIAYSRPGRGDVPGRDYDSRGWVNADLVEKLLPGLDADFYLCGPGEFLSHLVDELGRRGVPAARIHVEEFGRSA